MENLAQIIWDIDPEMLKIGTYSLRWYGFLFASAFLTGYLLLLHMYKQEGKELKLADILVIYIIVGAVIGVRLAHVFFYAPEYYLANPGQILAIWEGGLASHGAVIGIPLAIFLYVRKYKGESFLWIIDRVAVIVALCAAFVRFGNLFNSEIIGKPADLPWAFVFTSVDSVPRHPTQIYEAIAYITIFAVLFIYWKKKREELVNGELFGWVLTLLFGFRFFVEFLKENQSYFEAGWVLNMGQLLSLPVIAIGIYFVIRAKKLKAEGS